MFSRWACFRDENSTRIEGSCKTMTRGLVLTRTEGKCKIMTQGLVRIKPVFNGVTLPLCHTFDLYNE